jgi:hypothetical protein
MDSNYYVIAGYDLTGYETDKFEDWRWTDEGEEFFCYQSKGSIQLFDDPMNSNHLYLGYIFVDGNGYDFQTTKFDIIEAEAHSLNVNEKLRHLKDIGVISEDLDEFAIVYQFIAFAEYT